MKNKVVSILQKAGGKNERICGLSGYPENGGVQRD